MDKDKKRNISIIILLILAVLMIVFIVWWQYIRSEVEEINLNTSVTNNSNTQEILINLSNTATDLNVNAEATIEENLSIQRLANIFTERFGSYTSESEFQNTLDLKVYMTDSLQSWADNYVETQKNLISTSAYYSIITKVISTNIVSESEVEATVSLITQRTEFTEGEANNIFIQPLELEMKADNDVWLINNVIWGDKQ